MSIELGTKNIAKLNDCDPEITILKNLKSVTIKNKWRMEIRLESGSFGDVYVGTDIENEKLVAIKLESEHADSKQVCS